jgi:hypothetical protein
LGFEISNRVLEYLMKWKIEPYQEKLDSDILDDSDVMCMIINEIDSELMALDLLDLIEPNNCGCTHEFDDEEKLRKCLLDKNIIDNVECELSHVVEKIGFEEYENLCHYTNNDIMMLCIKKGWKNFCLKLLDFDVLYNINKQNITNSYQMSIEYNLLDVAEKIKNHKNFKLKV